FAFPPAGAPFVLASDLILANSPYSWAKDWDQMSAEVRVWDTATGRQTMLISGHNGDVRSLAFSQDGQRLILVSTSPGMPPPVTPGMVAPPGPSGVWEARVWNATTGEDIRCIKEEYRGEIPPLAVSPEGTRVAVASGMTVTVRDVNNPGHEGL